MTRPPLDGWVVAVTGAAGFLGSNLVRALVAQGANVHALLRPGGSRWRLGDVGGIACHDVDVRDGDATERSLTAIAPDAVFHLAITGTHPGSAVERRAVFDVAVTGTLNVLQALDGVRFRRLVHVGSSLEYGRVAERCREDDPERPVAFRGAAKLAATTLCRQYAQETRRPVVVLRPFSVYGAWESRRRLVPTALRCARSGEEMALTPPGHGRDLVFVDDVVDACLLCLEADVEPGCVINIGSGEWSADADVVAASSAAAGAAIRVRAGAYPATPGDTPTADVTRARRVLGWSPRHGLQEGLRRTLAWAVAHPQAWGLPSVGSSVQRGA